MSVKSAFWQGFNKEAASANSMKPALAIIERSDSNESRSYRRMVERSKKMFPRARVEFFDAKDHRPLVSKLDIKTFPHTVLLKGQQILSSHSGVLDEKTLTNLLKKSEMGG